MNLAGEFELRLFNESLAKGNYDTVLLNCEARLILITGFAGSYDVLWSITVADISLTITKLA